MDISKFKNYYKRTEVENIHMEIFKETSDYKNYCLGVAQGMYFIYDLIDEYKDRVTNNEDWLTVIRDVSSQEDRIKEYFTRFLNSKTE